MASSEQTTAAGTVVVGCREVLGRYTVFMMRAQGPAGELWWEHLDVLARGLPRAKAEELVAQAVSSGRAQSSQDNLRRVRCP